MNDNYRGLRGHHARTVLPLMAALAGSGCAGDGPMTDVTSVDSAGIRVTTITRPVKSFGPIARVSAEPVLSLGVVEGEGPEQFTRIGVVRGLPDGSVLIVDRASFDVRRFDASGRFMGAFGRSGEGPGEFRAIWDIIYADADSLWISDTGNRRVSIFTLEGVFGRSFRMAAQGGLFLPMERLTSGRLMGMGPSTLHRGEEGSIDRTTRVLVTLSEDGRDADTAAVLPALEYITVEGMGPMLFSRDLFIGVADDRVVGGPNDSFELKWWSGDGVLDAITRFPSADGPVSEEEVAVIIEERTRRAGGVENLSSREQVLFDTPPPPIRPAFGAIVGDAWGRAWVGRFEPWPRNVTHWWIFASDDQAPLGYVDTPEGLVVHHIDEHGVLGVETDDLGIQYVRRYALLPVE